MSEELDRWEDDGGAPARMHTFTYYLNSPLAFIEEVYAVDLQPWQRMVLASMSNWRYAVRAAKIETTELDE